MEVGLDQGFFKRTVPDISSIVDILFHEGIGCLIKVGKVAFSYPELNFTAFASIKIDLREVLQLFYRLAHVVAVPAGIQ